MFVYLDESGDAGFKLLRNSSRYFVIALLLVDDPIPLQRGIDDLRAMLGFAPSNEFKFSNSSERVRHAFLHMLLHHDFAARAIVVDKAAILDSDLRQRETFYRTLVRLVLTNGDGRIQDATLILDESFRGRKAKNEFSVFLRHSLNADIGPKKVRRIRYHASHTDNLIQAADMISGAIYARYHRGEDRYMQMIRPKIQDIWEWKPNPQETQ
ncbi:MAG: DUF3800 domain-containing protein [Thermomicrobiales bacterium]